MGPGPRFADREKMINKLKEPKPQNIREVPGYLVRIVSKFFYRLFYIFGLVWETKPSILLFMIFLALWDGLTPLVSALISKELLNALADAYMTVTGGGEADFSGIVKLLIVMFAFQFITGLVSLISNMFNNIAGELVVNHINLKIMYKSRDVDLASFDNPDFYERFENAKRESSMRPLNIIQSNFRIFSTVISMVSFIVILSAVSLLIPLLLVILSIPTAVVSFAYRKKNYWYMRFHSKERRQMSYYSDLITNKDMIKEIRVFGLSDTFIDRYKDSFFSFFSGLKKLTINEGLWNILIRVISTVANCIMFVVIAKGVAEGRYQVGDYSLYIGALQSVSAGVLTIITTMASIYEGTLFIDNLILFMNEERTIVPSVKEPRKITHHVGHKIEFKDVSFSYPGTTRKVIDHINLTIDAGDTCVLVGINGAGKTTLIKLLTRLYDPTEGVILLDGHDIKEYDTQDLYSMFGIIFQDFGKYAVSVKENITYGQVGKKPNEEEVLTAAKQSTADQFINELPAKYNTPLMKYFEESGIELSIGQWQKLSIARAFYSDSDIIILDEPTASLDALAEQEIYSQFDELRKDKTTIFVSHRLSSATVANKIVVLENGAVIEIGNHSELMKERGRYYELFSTQAKRYITPIDGVSAEDFLREDENVDSFLGEVKELKANSEKSIPDMRNMPDGFPAPPAGMKNPPDRMPEGFPDKGFPKMPEGRPGGDRK